MDKVLNRQNRALWTQWRLKRSFDIARERSLHNVWVWQSQILAAILLQQMNGTSKEIPNGSISLINDTVSTEESGEDSNAIFPSPDCGLLSREDAVNHERENIQAGKGSNQAGMRNQVNETASAGGQGTSRSFGPSTDKPSP